MRLRKTIDDPDFVEKNGLLEVKVPKTKCRFMQFEITVSGGLKPIIDLIKDEDEEAKKKETSGD